jgi:hypothetical protein
MTIYPTRFCRRINDANEVTLPPTHTHTHTHLRAPGVKAGHTDTLVIVFQVIVCNVEASTPLHVCVCVCVCVCACVCMCSICERLAL